MYFEIHSNLIYSIFKCLDLVNLITCGCFFPGELHVCNTNLKSSQKLGVDNLNEIISM